MFAAGDRPGCIRVRELGSIAEMEFRPRVADSQYIHEDASLGWHCERVVDSSRFREPQALDVAACRSRARLLHQCHDWRSDHARVLGQNYPSDSTGN